MKYTLKTSMAFAFAAVIMAGCTKDSKDPVSPPDDEIKPREPIASCVDTNRVLAASITADCNLPADSIYQLAGLTFVKSGATLTIGAGAHITGREDNELATLVVEPGAKLMAVGTKEKPIVFRPYASSGQERGDFGGVILLGKAKINVSGGSADIEGLVGVPYGGDKNDDNSGELRYVRIEYAGHLLGTDNEINGLTMGGVGSGTKISYVQQYHGLDDCFEWFGGTVSATHLAAYGCDDDMLDWDQGWSGSVQFAFGTHDGITNNDANGIEADNLNGTENASPRSNPKVYNITLIGNGTTSQDGIRLRRGTAGDIGNAIVAGFARGGGVNVIGNASIQQLIDGTLSGKAIYTYGNSVPYKVSPAAGLTDSVATVAAAKIKLAGWFTTENTSLGISAASPKPASAPTGAVAVPSGMTGANYLGAFDPSGALWTEGWTRSTTGEAPKGTPLATCVDTNRVITAEIKTNCELPGDQVYRLNGLTFVKSGATLTIGAGAHVTGREDNELATLVVEPGAKIMAIGTKEKPIVFRPYASSGQERGDFGGVILLGKAKINVSGGSADIEGMVGVPYGGDKDDDNSGELRYVRIEYAGHLLGTDNEINGLTMGGVGSGTKISYVQQFHGLDDCFEWFGGTVSASHLVAHGCDDDMFDWDQGWSGNLQFAFGAHDGITNNDANGIEADNLNGTENATPRSNPKVYNITLVGNGTTSQDGMRLRRGTAGTIGNAIVTGFTRGGGVNVIGNASIQQLIDSTLSGKAIYAYGNGTRLKVSPAAGLTDSAATVASAKTKLATWFLADTASLGVSATTRKPTSTGAGAVAVPTGFTAATYLGAFDPAATTLWTEGWTK